MNGSNKDVNLKYLIAFVFISLLVLSGCDNHKVEKNTEAIGEIKENEKDGVAAVPEAEEQPEEAAAADIKMQQSTWGEETEGIKSRVWAPLEIEHNLPIDIKFELQCNPKNLPSGVKKLNTLLFGEYLTLHLTNIQTGKTFNISILGPGMDALDDGSCFLPLDGKELEPLKASFLMVMHGEAISPGEYEGCVDYSFSRKKSCWRGTDADWDRQGFWTGTVTSGKFKMKITEETKKTKTLIVPVKVGVDENLQVRYVTEKIKKEVRNGYIIVKWSSDKSSIGWQTGSGIFDYGVICNLPKKYKRGNIDVKLSLQYFEVPAVYGVHLWKPGSDTPGYKLLWEGSIDFRLTERKINAMLDEYKRKKR